MTEKQCTRCKQILPIENFPISRWGKAKPIYKGRCKPCDAARRKELKDAAPERYRSYDKISKSRRKDKARVESSNWRRRNPERSKELGRLSYARHRENRVAESQARRALRYGVRGRITGIDIHLKYKAQEGKCYYCGIKLNQTSLAKGVVEHWIPLSRGGKNESSNIVMSCWDCNARKHAKMPWEFMPERFTFQDLTPP
ncbi:HNH endonuclease [Deinococcus actinosclerus]|uniref:HNH endonuclease n=1 Tax=Deinococcus actinosclerus TaxID=1768108 RepID=UPI0018D2534E|nr:HNH endonuclease [Deinococcus actinosclerus]